METPTDNSTNAETKKAMDTSTDPLTIEKVSEVLSKVVTDDGKIDWDKYEGELDDTAKTAVIAEKRRRDTQAAYTKAQQELKRIQAMAEVYKKYVSAEKLIPQDRIEELEELKYADPEAWRRELEKLEAEADKRLKDEISKKEEEHINRTEEELRAMALREYNALHPDKPLTEDILMLEIPPKYNKMLKDGEITYDEYLTKASEFIYGSKKVANVNEDNDEDREPNLGSVGGGSANDFTGGYTQTLIY